MSGKQVVPVDEALIPDEGREIPGCRLDNGGETIRIAFK